MLFYTKDILKKSKSFKDNLLNSALGARESFLIVSQSPHKRVTISGCDTIFPLEENSFKLRILLNLEKNHVDCYRDISATKVFSINAVFREVIDHEIDTNTLEHIDNLEGSNEIQFSKNKAVAFFKKSPLKIGVELLADIPLENEQQRMLIAEIKSIEVDKKHLTASGKIFHKKEKQTQEATTDINYNTRETGSQNSTSESDDSKDRSDNVVFDELTQTYNASLLPYATNVGAPKIEATNLASWKSANANNFNHLFSEKLEKVKQEYEALVTAFNTNEMLYNTAMNFKPIVGKTYHLYHKDSGENFLSLLPPESFKKKHLGAYKLNGDKVWEQVNHKEEVYG